MKTSPHLIALIRWLVDFFEVLYWSVAVVRRLGGPNPPCLTLRLDKYCEVSLTCFLRSASSKGPVMMLSISLQSVGST